MNSAVPTITQRQSAADKAAVVALAKRQYRLDELTYLLSTGTSHHEAVRQVGWTIEAAEIAARRTGLKELSRQLDAARGRRH